MDIEVRTLSLALALALNFTFDMLGNTQNIHHHLHTHRGWQIRGSVI